MLSASVNTIIEVTAGELVMGSAEAVTSGLCIDSRSVESGCAFVAFAGEQVDGHAFVGEAAARGARAILVTRADESVRAAVAAARRDVALVRVEDALRAVQDLAAYHRTRLMCPVVGVTGSTGKTTTKDFLAAALGRGGRVVATEGNRNNELGVPLTVLDAGATTEYLVVEMAMRGAGQIARLAEISKPTVGLITNVGVSHIELLGTPEAIREAKGELVQAIPADGMVFLNGDDAASEALAARTQAAVTSYGLGEECEVRADDIVVSDDGCASFTLVASAGRVEVTLGVPGRHNVYNALGAAAVALHLGLAPEKIAEGLAEARAADMRMQLFTTATGVSVINDAYNANPTSMRAALRTLTDMRTGGRRVAVLGGMAELGSLTELAHFRLGEEAAEAGLGTLVTVGPLAARIADGARAAGMKADAVRPCATAAEAVEVLDDLLAAGDVVLVKASRAIGLESVVEGLMKPRG